MYKYEEVKHKIFNEEWQNKFLKIRDRVDEFLSTAGAFRMENAISGISGEVWTIMACVDRLVELGEIKEISTGDEPGQYRVFVKNIYRGI